MKRKTVAVNCETIVPKINENGWSDASFSRLVRKYPSWFGEVKRGRNLPSPEEAARMCILLNTTPEKILLHEGKDEKETAKCQEDIKLVQELVEKEKGIKKAPVTEGEGSDKKISRFVRSASAEELDEIYRYIDFLESKRAKK